MKASEKKLLRRLTIRELCPTLDGSPESFGTKSHHPISVGPWPWESGVWSGCNTGLVDLFEMLTTTSKGIGLAGVSGGSWSYGFEF